MSDAKPTEDEEEDFSYLDNDEDGPGFERFHDPRVLRRQERKHAEAVRTLTDGAEELGPSHEMTYHAARHEKIWLQESLGTFYDQSLLADVLFLVKGGKELTALHFSISPDYGSYG